MEIPNSGFTGFNEVFYGLCRSLEGFLTIEVLPCEGFHETQGLPHYFTYDLN